MQLPATYFARGGVGLTIAVRFWFYHRRLEVRGALQRGASSLRNSNCSEGEHSRNDCKLYAGISGLAARRRLDHCGVGEASANPLHGCSRRRRIAPEPTPIADPLSPSAGSAPQLE